MKCQVCDGKGSGFWPLAYLVGLEDPIWLTCPGCIGAGTLPIADDPDTDATLRWAGAGAETSEPAALEQMARAAKEAGQ